MKLKKFILELNKISKNTIDLDKIDVRMADDLPVMDLILKDKTIYVTDVKNKSSKNTITRHKIF